MVEYFLKAGIPLHKVDDLRVLLARGERSEAQSQLSPCRLHSTAA